MRNPISCAALVLSLTTLTLTACESVTESEFNSAACPQTFEFGNDGCARYVVLVDAPSGTWPSTYRWVARVSSIDSVLVFTDIEEGLEREPVHVRITRDWSLWRTTEDTVSLWVSVKLLEEPQPIQVGVPLPVFAADSTLRIVRFTDVGKVPPVDTIRLTLR